jgi:hypothetical protein
MDLLAFYKMAKQVCIDDGFEREIKFVEERKFENQTADDFARQFMYVILNSGMNNKIAEGMYTTAMKHGLQAIGHPGKRAAIIEGFANKEKWFETLRSKGTVDEKLAYLETLPWIGPITKYHLARNLGIDVAKPDRHMVRIANQFNYPNIQKMCEYLSLQTGDRIGSIDVTLWRFARTHPDWKGELKL